MHNMSNFIILHVDIQFPQKYELKRLPLLPCVLGAFVKHLFTTYTLLLTADYR